MTSLKKYFAGAERNDEVENGATFEISFHATPADLTVSKRSGTSNRIEIYFAVFNHLYLYFSFMKLAETLRLCLVKRIINLS